MAISSQSRPGPLAIPSARGAWIAAGASLALAAVALCVIFSVEAKGAFDVWLASTAYNHCFLVLPVALYLVWIRRGWIGTFVPRPDFRALLLLVPLGMMWAVAALMSVLEAQQLVVMTMFQVIALAVLGWTLYRAMLLPFLYLFFLVPTGYFLVPYLQDWTAAFAVEGLKLAGIPVFSDGMFIEVPSGNFVIAEACAGLRFLIASVAFGVFFAALVYRSRVRWIAFVFLSVVVPIIANGFRALGIIALSEWTGNATAVEADHIVYGWVFFSAVTLLLIIIGFRFADDRLPAPPAPPQSAAPASASRPASVVAAALVGLALAAGGPAYARIQDWRAGDTVLAQAVSAPHESAWKPTNTPPFGWKPTIHDPDGEYLQGYSNGRDDVLLYTAIYKSSGFHNNLVRATNDITDDKVWRLASHGSASASIAGTHSTVAAATITGLGERLVVWQFYVVDGRVAATPLMAKLLQLRQLFEGGRAVDAFVAVATLESAPKSEAEDTLRAFLADLALPGIRS